MEPEHLARDDISALAWDVEETSWEGRKTSLNDRIQAFLVVELNRGAVNRQGRPARPSRCPGTVQRLGRALLARSMRAARSRSREGPGRRVGSAAIMAPRARPESEGWKNIADWPSCSRWTGISDTI